jgi:Fe-S cluster biosynthesis and repair protein YggX
MNLYSDWRQQQTVLVLIGGRNDRQLNLMNLYSGWRQQQTVLVLIGGRTVMTVS